MTASEAQAVRDLMARLKKERDRANALEERIERLLGSYPSRATSRSRVTVLERQLAAKQRALDFAIQRNEVLRRRAT